MKALLICPAESAGSAFFSRCTSLALCPMLGRSALDRSLEDLASRGATEVIVLASDRPQEIRRAVGDGKAWGLKKIEVLSISGEISIEEGRMQYGASREWLAQPHDVQRLQPWPEAGAADLWMKPAKWLDSLVEHLPSIGRNAVGMREVEPGIWVGTKARIAETSRLTAPCWIGRNAVVASGASVGPNAIVEEGAFVDGGAEVTGSFAGPATYVGSFVDLRDSLAWGRNLLDWRTESLTEVPDAILLGDLRGRLQRKHGNVFCRLAALIAMVVTAPVLLAAWWRLRGTGRPLMSAQRAVAAPIAGDPAHSMTWEWRSLNGMGEWARRWPELWNIARGQFTWVGNRPLTPDQAGELTTDFERLWLASTPGLISLSDAEGCQDAFGDEARAHAAFYSASISRSGDLAVIGRWLSRFFKKAWARPEAGPELSHPAVYQEPAFRTDPKAA